MRLITDINIAKLMLHVNKEYAKKNDVTSELSKKSNVGHKHTADEISGITTKWVDVIGKPATFPATLGTTSNTAYRGDYGNTAYAHSQAAHAPVSAQKNSDITKAEIEAKLTGGITTHNHDGLYYTEGEIDSLLKGKANSSHGNHVPATQTADNTKFLRNDNTWQSVTPANIGARPSTWVPAWGDVTGKPTTFNPTIGTTSTTAFRGDYGNAAYLHSQAAHAPATAQKNSDITKAEIEAKLIGGITTHNHDVLYYTEGEIDALIKGLTPASIGAAAATHNHQAAQVTFTDGKTFQQKLDDGSLKGPAGAKGATGAVGPQGPIGNTGATGSKGADGITPTIGTNGNWYLGSTDTGKPSRGATGPQGLKGDQGIQGPKGTDGAKGATGAKGVSIRLKGAWNSTTSYVNDTSYIDIVTSSGNTYACKASNTNQAVTNTTYWELIAQKGAQGPKGDTGATGPQGPAGTAGAKGATGAQGPIGPKGDTGLQGPKGNDGAKGATGATGPQGPAGTTPTIGTNGNWYLGSTDTGKPSGGATGPQGPKGNDGLTTSVTVGSTKYTHVSGNITLPAYPTLSSLGGAASNHTHNYAATSHKHSMADVIDGNTAATATGSIYFNNAGTEHVGRLSCYNNATNGDYVSLGLYNKTSAANVTYITMYKDHVNISKEIRSSVNRIELDGHYLTISTSAPSGPSTGDIWIDI